MSKTISKEMVRKGFAKGFISVYDGDGSCGCLGICCRIGDNEFYFAGLGNVESNKYLETTPFNKIIDDIYGTLEEFRKDEDFFDEYEYYRLFLEEQLEADKATKYKTYYTLRMGKFSEETSDGIEYSSYNKAYDAMVKHYLWDINHGKPDDEVRRYRIWETTESNGNSMTKLA